MILQYKDNSLSSQCYSYYVCELQTQGMDGQQKIFFSKYTLTSWIDTPYFFFKSPTGRKYIE